MKLASFPIALALSLALVAPAAAQTCYTTTEPTLQTPPTGVSLSSADGIYYLKVDSCMFAIGGCAFSVWLYEETNGIDGLQRHDDHMSDVRACGDGTPPDTTLF